MIRISMLMLGAVGISAAAVTPFDDSSRHTTDQPSPTMTPPAASTPAASPAVNPASVIPAADVSIDLADLFHGVARPAQRADLPPLVRGTIGIVHVMEGQSVEQGTPLITLDSRVPAARLEAATVKASLRGALRRAEVEYRMAKRRCERLEQATLRGAAADFEREEAEAVRDQAQAALQQQRDLLQVAEADRQLAAAQLDQYTITAPFDGRITEIHQKSGMVDPSAPLISMASLETLEAEMHLPSQLFGTVRQGQQMNLRAGAPVNGILTATVVSVSPVINSASDTFRCLLSIPNKNSGHPAGFTVVLNTDPRTDAPAQAMQTAGRRTHSARR